MRSDIAVPIFCEHAGGMFWPEEFFVLADLTPDSIPHARAYLRLPCMKSLAQVTWVTAANRRGFQHKGVQEGDIWLRHQHRSHPLRRGRGLSPRQSLSEARVPRGSGGEPQQPSFLR